MRARGLSLFKLFILLVCLSGCGDIIETENNLELDNYMKAMVESSCPDVGLTAQSWSVNAQGEKELQNYFQCFLNSQGWLDRREFHSFSVPGECPNEECLYSVTYYKYYETFYDMCTRNWDWNANRLSDSSSCQSFDYKQQLERARMLNNG